MDCEQIYTDKNHYQFTVSYVFVLKSFMLQPFLVDGLIFFFRTFDKREFIKINYETELFAFKNRLSLANMEDDTLIAALTHESYNDHNGENNSILSMIGTKNLNF